MSRGLEGKKKKEQQISNKHKPISCYCSNNKMTFIVNVALNALLRITNFTPSVFITATCLHQRMIAGEIRCAIALICITAQLPRPVMSGFFQLIYLLN